MRYLLVFIIARSLFSAAVWFVKTCFQVGLLLGAGVGRLLKSKRSDPQIDPSAGDARSVRPLRDE
jgi:hypothetical protein